MKTLVVLSALAAVAIAAPALPEPGHEIHQTKSSKDVSLHGSGKSASPQTFNNEALHEIGNTTPLQLDSAAHEPSARLHLGLKKPLLIKKKFGSSHLYRDSGEEQPQADTQEQCMEEVKVKLCDAGKMKKADKVKSTIIEDVETHTRDSDVEHSIQMAKEAVENLQRGLLNLEHKPVDKMSQWKHSNSESDDIIHQDIEAARQALEHIQQNFGNLESMNLRAATLKDTENLHDSLKTKTESEEARFAQWKEAIDNIQKNVEIAKNIEDSFKSAEHDNTSSDSKTMKKMDTLDKKSELHETAMKSTDEKAAEDVLSQQDADMTVSASSPVEMKINHDSKIKPLEKKASEAIEKSSVTEDKTLTEGTVTKEKSVKSDEETSNKNKNTVLKSSENSENFVDSEPAQSTLLFKSADKFEQDLEHISAKKSQIEQEKSASSWKEPVEKILLAKTSGHEKSANLDTTKLMKSADQVEKKEEHELKSNDSSTASQKVQQSSIGKSAEAPNPHSILTMKSADHVGQQNAQENELTKESSSKQEGMTGKAVEESPIQLLEASVNSDSSIQPSRHVEMKAADFPVLLPVGKSVNLDSSMQPSLQTEIKAADFSILSPMGKSVHLDNRHHPQIEMKAAEEKSANKMLQWKQINGARGAYGLGGYGAGLGGAGSQAAGVAGIGGFGSGASAGATGGSGSGAVGVFPNANVGGCAIPLLLSCSPSVVSGSLAKSHPTGYGAPAYRMGEDFKYNFKRDTKKTNDIPSTKVKRTNTKRVEKIYLDKKL